MPTIEEEHEGTLVSLLCGEPSAAFNVPTSTPFDLGGSPMPCPLHPGQASCPCHGFVGDWDLAGATAFDVAADPEEPDYSKFENWIPQYAWPDKPCDYCRSRKLMCYIQRGEPFCTPCSSLFRECSLNSQTLEATNYAEMPVGNFLDTLHLVQEDVATEHGTFTGIKPLRSKTHGSVTAGSIPVDDAPGSSKRTGNRFPRQAVKILRDWLEEHKHNPYPTDEEKTELEVQTELSPVQISTWLANARRRKKLLERSRPKMAMSPSLGPTTPAIAIPMSADKPWDELNPLQRWQHSPPENEPATIENIASAVANSTYRDDAASSSASSFGRRGKASSGCSSGSRFKAHSTASHESISGRTSSLTASSAAFSHGSSHDTHGSFGSFRSSLVGKKDRKRRRRATPPQQQLTESKKRVFQCTFCTDTFKSKYDWTRHEKSLHLSLEKWVCCPQGPIVTDSVTGDTRCAYCELGNPSADHIESHNHRQCSDKGIEGRTFYRKDHLRQHMRLMHGCELYNAMESWRSAVVQINSRCGFCAQRFTTWPERVDHLTAHFKAGARMIDWKGCRGLDPGVAALVTNGMPPYLIGIESASPNPFSASNRATWRLPEQFGSGKGSTSGGVLDADLPQEWLDSSESKTTCWEVLTIRLGKYAKQMAAQGVVMTDAMLQAQARRIVYDSDDAWDHTAADNPEWLDLFKKASGLDFVPSEIGGQGAQIPEDLETYGDLGLRIPFAIQLQACSARFGKETTAFGLQMCSAAPDTADVQSSANGRTNAASKSVESRATDAARERMARMLQVQDALARQSPDVSAAQARARGLAALTSLEAPLADECSGPRHAAPSQAPHGGKHLPRHRYELPVDRAQQFATVTPSWQDSGQMPTPVATASLGSASSRSPRDLASTPDIMADVSSAAGGRSTVAPQGDDLGRQLDEILHAVTAAGTLPTFSDVLAAVSDAPGADTVPFDWTTLPVSMAGFNTPTVPLDFVQSATTAPQEQGKIMGGMFGLANDALALPLMFTDEQQQFLSGASDTYVFDEQAALDDIFDLQMEG